MIHEALPKISEIEQCASICSDSRSIAGVDEQDL